MKVPKFLANKGLGRIPGIRRAQKHFRKTEVETYYGCKLKLDPNDSMNLSTWGFYEKEESDLIQEFVKPGMVCVDIGANIGYFTLMLAQLVGPKGKVIAFEPHPLNVQLLWANIHLNNFYDGRVKVIPRAVTNYIGTIDLYENPHSSGMHTVETRLIEEFETYTDEHILKVPCTTLDYELFDNKIKVDFLKMDVEGHEMTAIAGGTKTFTANETMVFLMEYITEEKKLYEQMFPQHKLTFLNEKNVWGVPKND